MHPLCIENNLPHFTLKMSIFNSGGWKQARRTKRFWDVLNHTLEKRCNLNDSRLEERHGSWQQHEKIMIFCSWSVVFFLFDFFVSADLITIVEAWGYQLLGSLAIIFDSWPLPSEESYHGRLHLLRAINIQRLSAICLFTCSLPRIGGIFILHASAQSGAFSRMHNRWRGWSQNRHPQ